MQINLRCQIPSKNKDAAYVIAGPNDLSSVTAYWGRWSTFENKGLHHLQSQIKYPTKAGQTWKARTIVFDLIRQKKNKGYRTVFYTGVPSALVNILNGMVENDGGSPPENFSVAPVYALDPMSEDAVSASTSEIYSVAPIATTTPSPDVVIVEPEEPVTRFPNHTRPNLAKPEPKPKRPRRETRAAWLEF